MDENDKYNFSISQCEILEIISDVARFLIHITLVFIFTNLIDNKELKITYDLLKSLVVTSIAVITYNVLFKKIINYNINLGKKKCVINVDDAVDALYVLRK
jgi:hypothetical protein